MGTTPSAITWGQKRAEGFGRLGCGGLSLALGGRSLGAAEQRRGTGQDGAESLARGGGGRGVGRREPSPHLLSQGGATIGSKENFSFQQRNRSFTLGGNSKEAPKPSQAQGGSLDKGSGALPGHPLPGGRKAFLEGAPFPLGGFWESAVWGAPPPQNLLLTGASSSRSNWRRYFRMACTELPARAAWMGVGVM